MFKISKKRQASRLFPPLLLFLALAGAAGWSARFSSAQSGATASPPAPFSHSLPQLDGSHLRATVVEVNYAPREADKPQAIPAP